MDGKDFAQQHPEDQIQRVKIIRHLFRDAGSFDEPSVLHPLWSYFDPTNRPAAPLGMDTPALKYGFRITAGLFASNKVNPFSADSKIFHKCCFLTWQLLQSHPVFQISHKPGKDITGVLDVWPISPIIWQPSATVAVATHRWYRASVAGVRRPVSPPLPGLLSLGAGVMLFINPTGARGEGSSRRGGIAWILVTVYVLLLG